MTDMETELRKQLLQMVQMRQQLYVYNQIELPKLRFQTNEELILRHGRVFPRAKTAPALRIPKACFQLSYRMATKLRSQWVYCEGFAISRRLGLAIHHAWATPADGSGEAFDSAWDDGLGDSCYLGIPFTVDFIKITRKQSKWQYYSVLDSFWNDFPLLTGAVKIENVIWKKETSNGVTHKSKKRQTRIEMPDSASAKRAHV